MFTVLASVQNDTSSPLLLAWLLEALYLFAAATIPTEKMTLGWKRRYWFPEHVWLQSKLPMQPSFEGGSMQPALNLYGYS